MTEDRRMIAFVSSNATWGGSEDLWSAAAAALAADGHRVDTYKNQLDYDEPSVGRLLELGCRPTSLARIPFLPRRIYWWVAALTYPLTFGYQAVLFYLTVKLRRRPDLLVVSQGGNHDGWLFARAAMRLGLPYVLISQKATDLYWPLDSRREAVKACYRAARWCYFVSEHNLRLTEEQLGMRLPHASVVRNPFKVSWEPRDEWPGTDLGFRFACVGRLYPKEKGQDLLLRVLAREKWRSRPVSLTFYGSGEQEQGLKEMAALLGLDNVHFGGFAGDVNAVWDRHHALLLATRAEGLPLVLVEAMLAGRVAIVTDVAGNREMLDDGETGFIATAPAEDAMDEAMERAWQRRGDWQAIGREAARRVRERVPADPAAQLAGDLIRIAGAPLPLAVIEDAASNDDAAAPPDEGRRLGGSFSTSAQP